MSPCGLAAPCQIVKSNCSFRNASAKAQKALMNSPRLQKPQRKQASLYSPQWNLIYTTVSRTPPCAEKTKDNLTALTGIKPLLILFHIFMKYAILF